MLADLPGSCRAQSQVWWVSPGTGPPLAPAAGSVLAASTSRSVLAVADEDLAAIDDVVVAVLRAVVRMALGRCRAGSVMPMAAIPPRHWPCAAANASAGPPVPVDRAG